LAVEEAPSAVVARLLCLAGRLSEEVCVVDERDILFQGHIVALLEPPLDEGDVFVAQATLQARSHRLQDAPVKVPHGYLCAGLRGCRLL
jgi:hypothetical protein